MQPAAPTRPSITRSLATAMVTSAHEPLLLLDAALGIVAASRSFCAAFGIDPATIDGRLISALGAGEWASPTLTSLLAATVTGGAEVDAYELDLKRDGKLVRRLVVNAHKLDYDDSDGIRLLLAVSDVTDARARDKQRDDLAREKAVLLQELQHRIANSLQIIASVLMQSARRTASEESRMQLHAAHHRVMSIASVQRQLSESVVGDVALGPYLRQLCQSIGASMIHDPAQLLLETHVEECTVSSDVSISLGLIVTELVINALKHAYPEKQSGLIQVRYWALGEEWTLCVEDDGIGMPTGADAPKAGLGSVIVQSLAKQLHAAMLVADARPGTRVTISHRLLADEPVMAAV